MTKRDREDRSSEEAQPRISRASPRPETLSPSLGKRTRVESPTRGHIITSVAASDFTPMDDDITPEMATNFERQVGRLPTGMTVANCVVGKAYTSLDTRLRIRYHVRRIPLSATEYPLATSHRRIH